MQSISRVLGQIQTDDIVEYASNWAAFMDTARTLTREALFEELNLEQVGLLRTHLAGESQPGSDESGRLCAAVFKWLSRDFDKSGDIDCEITLQRAKWHIIRHTLYLLRGSSEEERLVAGEVDCAINRGRELSNGLYFHLSEYLLDQFLTKVEWSKKYEVVFHDDDYARLLEGGYL